MNQEKITLILLLIQNCIHSDPEYESVDISSISNYLYTFSFILLNWDFSPCASFFAMRENLDVYLTFFLFGGKGVEGGNKAAILFGTYIVFR